MFTGVSGSGKSTLAFDTIYAEAQRRQVQSMSAFARSFLEELDKPDADALEGLCPAVALDDRTLPSNPRSTVGTITDVYDLLRVLYSRAGEPHCTSCGDRLRFDGGWLCPRGDVELGPSMTSRGFSFNSAYGACVECHGLGTEPHVDLDLVVPDPERSLAGGALAAWRDPSTGAELTNALTVAGQLGVDVEAPWRTLPAAAHRALLTGEGVPQADETTGRVARQQRFQAVVPWLLRRYHEAYLTGSRDRAAAFIRHRPCAACGGARLNSRQRAVLLRHPTRGGVGIAQVCAMTVSDALRFFEELDADPPRRELTSRVLEEITTRLRHLADVGLDHLTLDRATPTLSRGEVQRLRLAQHLGTELFGLLFVLDEPTTGLHPADVERLLVALRRLRDQGNSVLVIEHDDQVVRAADWVVDLGPGAGEEGGRILHSGSVGALLDDGRSLTGGYLTGRLSVGARRGTIPEGVAWLEVRGARAHNLADLDVGFPLGCFTVVTGVSGSGKSTLVDHILYRTLARALHDEPVVPGTHDGIDGLELVDRAVRVEQSPIGRSPRSNAATYTGAFDAIRAAFARTDDARERGFKAGRFSFNSPGGRCENCAGEGSIRIDMRFLPDVYAPCQTCLGSRYLATTLEVRYSGLTIAEVLELAVDAALELFAESEPARRPLQALADVGLGYLRLGQPAPTLSAGEAQRVKLAAELSRGGSRTLYLLDEPTSGLHPHDIGRLLQVLHGLVDNGNTVVAVEHHVSVVASADWIIELGPGAGTRGGRLVCCGTPEQVVGTGHSLIGQHVRRELERRSP
ncbi:MAG TPA: excinuclease ABC subunit UvrA [Nitriliruptorales bacterium]|nr:excinuclease ABC subunit UvrA [Nitriliruptorales bacterium]